MSNERDERVRRLFAEAMERGPEERNAWLEHVCKDDSALRREIETLLEAFETHSEDLDRVLEGLPQLSDLAAGVRSEEVRSDDIVGQKVRHYQILERLGEGGMGVVYKARDERLHRTVALKFLPAELTRDAGAKRRLIHEARSASALDHPNICTIYEINEGDDGHLFIAMAFVDGETLAHKLLRRPLPIDDAIDIAIQVAAGLACAHEIGITHRDVKPGNVMVTERGQVKIVDFGLAKVPDVTLTRSGVTLGTTAYMSPEQVRDETVDRRTDIWALGVLIYEMVTGQRPFKGDRDTTVAHAILSRDPEPVSALRSGVPLALEGIVAKALEKDPASRYQHVDEIPVDLRALQKPSGSRSRTLIPVGPTRRVVRSRPWRWVLAGVGIGLLLGVVALTLWWATHSVEAPSAASLRFAIDLPPEHELASMFQPFAVSPDGTRLVYAAGTGDGRHLYLRSLDRLDVAPIPGTEGGNSPFFSPDGRWIGFFAEDKLKKVRVDGGIPQTLCDAPGESIGSNWGPDDTILMSLGVTSGLLQVSALGGAPRELTVPRTADGEVGHAWPQHLPGGNDVLFTIWGGEAWRTAVLSVETGNWHTVMEGGAAAQYLPTGHLIYAEMAGGLAVPALLAAPFDGERHKITGAAVSVLDYPGLDGPNFAVSRTGTLVYASEGSAWPVPDANELVWVNAEGQVTPVLDQPGRYHAPRLSPVGSRVAFVDFSGEGAYDIWVYDLDRPSSTRLTTVGNINNFPVWTPDGGRIVFTSTRSTPGLYLVAVDGRGEAEQLLQRTQHPQLPGSWTPDGRTLAYTQITTRTKGDIWTLPVDGDPEPLLESEHDERSPRFSPDGTYLAYVSDETGRHEVYVRPYGHSEPALLVSKDGGREPVWSRDGETLYYRVGDAVMAARIATQLRLSVSEAGTLFEGPFESGTFGQANYDVDLNGRFLMVQRSEAPSGTQLHIVLNWFDELRERLGQD